MTINGESLSVRWLFKWQPGETEQSSLTAAYVNTWTFTYPFPEFSAA
jgi:hypothetical protein